MKKTVVIAVTVPLSRLLLKGQLSYLKSQGFDVILVSSGSSEMEQFAGKEGVVFRQIAMSRKISILGDLLAVLKWCCFLKNIKPGVTVYGTPKASLLGAIACAVMGESNHLYLMRGLPFETSRGIKRWILGCCEWLCSSLSTATICVSRSLKESAINSMLSHSRRSLVLGKGSSNGVDTSFYNPARFDSVDNMREQCGIPEGDVVLGYAGRLAKDKGIETLLFCVEYLESRESSASLLIAGDFDDRENISADILSVIKSHPKIHFQGFVEDMRSFYSEIDLLLFPSSREGMPNVVLEASSFEVPVIGFRVTGVRDAIVHGSTGFLVEWKDDASFATYCHQLVEQPQLCERLGKNARRWVSAHFKQKEVWKRYSDTYSQFHNSPELVKYV